MPLDMIALEFINQFDSTLESLGRDDPINVTVMDVEDFIKENKVKEVSSLLSFEPSSTKFEEKSLFSETIFGNIGSDDRFKNFGYINLNTTILTPVIYRALVKLSQNYERILSGKEYAIFDKKEKDFVLSDSDNAETGYSFFLKHFPNIKYKTSSSIVRDNKINLINKFKSISFINKLLVLPAGLREIHQTDSGNLEEDEINTLYKNVLRLSFHLEQSTVSDIYDFSRYRMQQEVVGIYNYLKTILDGKKGFLQGGGYSSRNVALGTRNVLTSANFVSKTPNDPKNLKTNETMLGIFQTLKGLNPVSKFYLKDLFLNPIFKDDTSVNIPLTNLSTYTLEYVEISYDELERFTNSESINKLIDNFKNTDIRYTHPIVTGKNKKDYGLWLIYDDELEIYSFRSIEDLKLHFGNKGKSIDKEKIRFMTWAEIFYIVTYFASINRHIQITRYPILNDLGTYVSRIHLASTLPDRVVRYKSLPDNPETPDYIQFYRYPIIGNSFFDSVTVNTSKLSGLGGDFDGDTASCNYIMSNEGNEEANRILNDIKNHVNSEEYFTNAGGSDLVDMTLGMMAK